MRSAKLPKYFTNLIVIGIAGMAYIKSPFAITCNNIYTIKPYRFAFPARAELISSFTSAAVTGFSTGGAGLSFLQE